MTLGVFPPLQSFGRVLHFMFGRTPQWSHLVLDFCLLGVCFFCCFFCFFFKLQIVFHFWWSVCANYQFLLDSVLVGCICLDICPFLLGCPICWPIIVHSILLWYFCISVVLVVILLFNFLLCLFGSSLFFLVSLARGLPILFILSKHQLLVLLIFFSIVF